MGRRGVPRQAGGAGLVTSVEGAEQNLLHTPLVRSRPRRPGSRRRSRPGSGAAPALPDLAGRRWRLRGSPCPGSPCRAGEAEEPAAFFGIAAAGGWVGGVRAGRSSCSLSLGYLDKRVVVEGRKISTRAGMKVGIILPRPPPWPASAPREHPAPSRGGPSQERSESGPLLPREPSRSRERRRGPGRPGAEGGGHGCPRGGSCGERRRVAEEPRLRSGCIFSRFV